MSKWYKVNSPLTKEDLDANPDRVYKVIVGEDFDGELDWDEGSSKIQLMWGKSNWDDVEGLVIKTGTRGYFDYPFWDEESKVYRRYDGSEMIAKVYIKRD